MIQRPRATYKELGIVLHTIKYGERKMIVNMLTQHHGRCGYIVSVGSGVSKGSVHRSLLQPLRQLEFEGEMPSRQDGLHKISEVRVLGVDSLLSYSPVRSTLTMFMSEVLYRLLKDCDAGLYEFVKTSIEQLDELALNKKGNALANFHLYFLVALANELGYTPQNNHSVGDYFDIKEGGFTTDKPEHNLYFDPQKARLLSEMLWTKFKDIGNFELNRDERRSFLYSMIDYFGYHTDSIHRVRSIEMLSEVL